MSGGPLVKNSMADLEMDGQKVHSEDGSHS